jgi:hypothetical protein
MTDLISLHIYLRECCTFELVEKKKKTVSSTETRCFFQSASSFQNRRSSQNQKYDIGASLHAGKNVRIELVRKKILY